MGGGGLSCGTRLGCLLSQKAHKQQGLSGPAESQLIALPGVFLP